MENTIQLKQSDISLIREQFIKDQNNICPICNNEINKPVLDHSHKKRIKGTGLCRKVICSQCNIFLGKIENNCVRYGIQQRDLPIILRSIAEYLEQPHSKYIHPSEKPKSKLLKKSSYNQLKRIYKGRAKFPEYPKSKKLTKSLTKLFKKYNIEPEFYKD